MSTAVALLFESAQKKHGRKFYPLQVQEIAGTMVRMASELQQIENVVRIQRSLINKYTEKYRAIEESEADFEGSGLDASLEAQQDALENEGGVVVPLSE